ncbi:hypothetical protein [Qipengyuania oceanensis]|uniref:Uncharacterized protein n=1 Tax=Qipengyuania oceanensis TaxID=1463597 RepID=A0A844YH15_9SPHN|nr:hypothetical protein [Qipengyuania oceanensis]MXO63421.1 hypothetical protein [Qipengyuania oceanensis]
MNIQPIMVGPSARRSPFGLFGSRPDYATPGFGDGSNANGEQMPVAQHPLDASESSPGHWTVGGMDQMREAMPRQAPQPASQGPLGGSMRQPFDMNSALETLRGKQKKFGPWKFMAAGLADAISGQSRMVPMLLQMKAAQEGRNQDAAETVLGWRHGAWQDQNRADLRAAAPFTIGRDRVQYNPASGQAQVIYDGADDFENYARQLGLEPGSDEYYNAVQDYVLRSSGPSAHERDVELDDHRTDNDRSLENLRYGNRVGMERLRQSNRQGMVSYRNANPPPVRSRTGGSGGGGKKASGGLVEVSTPAEAAKLKPGTKYRTPDGEVFTR